MVGVKLCGIALAHHAQGPVFHSQHFKQKKEMYTWDGGDTQTKKKIIVPA